MKKGIILEIFLRNINEPFENCRHIIFDRAVWGKYSVKIFHKFSILNYCPENLNRPKYA